MMQWMLLTTLATLSGPPDAPLPVEAASSPLKIDLLLKAPAQKCDAQSSDEIIVCAQKTDNESQRLRPIANALVYDKDESSAEFGISENARMAVQAESEELQQGIIAKRMMVRLKIKF